MKIKECKNLEEQISSSQVLEKIVFKQGRGDINNFLYIKTMLSKQSIRKNHTIFYNGELVEKDVIIELSKDFNEMEIKRFKKMLQQGGSFKVKGNSFKIIREDNQHRNNKGEVESPFIKSSEE